MSLPLTKEKAMNKNICPCERAVRVVAGLALASLAFWGPQNMWFLLGLVPAVFGLIGWCPLYAALKINRAESCKCSCCCKQDGDKGQGGDKA